eukprot:254793_1
MTGDIDVQTSSTFHVTLRCITDVPSRSPTNTHVTTTTEKPTYAPVDPITAHPSTKPTPSPLNEPTTKVTKQPSELPTTKPRVHRPTPGEWTITSEEADNIDIATGTETPQKEGIQSESIIDAIVLVAGTAVACGVCTVLVLCYGYKHCIKRSTKSRRASEDIVNITMDRVASTSQAVTDPRTDIRELVLPPFPVHLQATN